MLDDRVFIITGASAGIGAATARAAAAAGMDVVLTARRGDALERVADDVRTHGRRALVIEADVTAPGASEHLIDAAWTEFRRCDAVFANAGYGLHRAFTETTDAEWRRMFDVNFFAGVDLLRVAARRMISTSNGGHLLMCSSCLSKFSLPHHAAYCATKAAQDAACGALRHEMRPHGIAVSSVHPITTTTEFFEVAAKKSGRDGPLRGQKPGFLVQTPERVANAVIDGLRSRTPEVWTSHLVRLAAAAATASPRLGDFIFRKVAERRGSHGTR